MSGFSFPSLPGWGRKEQQDGSPGKAPLTAQSTVTSISSSGRAEVKPVQVVDTNRSNLETRNKVPLEKGYSQVDWMRLSRAVQPPPPRKDITMAEVKQHKTPEDAWMVFRNRVYNITPYLRFHPGGSDMLMKAAGKDGTSLFMKYHPWVAIDALMEKHLIGLLQAPDTPAGTSPSGASPAPISPTRPDGAAAGSKPGTQQEAAAAIRSQGAGKDSSSNPGSPAKPGGGSEAAGGGSTAAGAQAASQPAPGSTDAGSSRQMQSIDSLSRTEGIKAADGIASSTTTGGAGAGQEQRHRREPSAGDGFPGFDVGGAAAAGAAAGPSESEA